MYFMRAIRLLAVGYLVLPSLNKGFIIIIIIIIVIIIIETAFKDSFSPSDFLDPQKGAQLYVFACEGNSRSFDINKFPVSYRHGLASVNQQLINKAIPLFFISCRIRCLILGSSVSWKKKKKYRKNSA